MKYARIRFGNCVKQHRLAPQQARVTTSISCECFLYHGLLVAFAGLTVAKSVIFTNA
jgi:hypothetical protein